MDYTNLAYVFSAVLFILGIKRLSSPKTARNGNAIASTGMLVAIIATLISFDLLDYKLIIIGMGIGGVIGILFATRVEMTQMPQMVAIFNGFGGGASALIASAEYLSNYQNNSLSMFLVITITLSVFIGTLTLTGSFIAFGKLQGFISGQPILFPGQQPFNALLAIGIVVSSYLLASGNLDNLNTFYAIIAISALMGITLTIPIGGADMPVVIALLNSFSGLAACAAGFVILNNVLIVSGALVGASGLILTNIMCKAMNRSLANVLFSGFGAVSDVSSSKYEDQGEVKPINIQDAFLILEAASSVLIVPGYGMAVAQAQHSVRELGELLEKNGTEVQYAIHPVAGRMPGHMNVLLAEANVSYDVLVEPEDVNPTMETVDVCMVIGANDVVNPDAKENEGSPIYGMPIIEVDRAKTVFVLKRSMASGFAGIQNPLFFKSNSRMLFGDAKDSVSNLVSEFKD